jgi:rare lipoprotein A
LRRAGLTCVTLAVVLIGGYAEISRALRGYSLVAPNPIYKVGRPYQINGVWYRPAENYTYKMTGIASFYGGETRGINFHGRLTANGEIYDMHALTAAHKTLPMPSTVRVTNLENGRSVILRVNDRGPFIPGRIIDVSRRAANILGFEQQGTARVRVEILAAESRALKEAMLRGRPAPPLNGQIPDPGGSKRAAR